MANLEATTRELARGIQFPMLWLLMASAMLIESDLYRYVTVFLVIFAVVCCGADVKRISCDWLAFLCYAFSAYVAIRFAFGIFVFHEKGTSEWLYVFPVLFPLVGAALYATRRYIFPAATLLIACGFIGLLLTIDFRAIFAGERAPPLFHHNSIHAGVGSSMVFLTAVFWLINAGETGRLHDRFKWHFLALGITTALLSLVGVLGSQSKGAWLALVATITLMGVLAIFRFSGKGRLRFIGILLLAGVTAATIAAPYVEKVAGTTIDAAVRLSDYMLVADEGPLVVIRKSIDDPSTPSSMRERLKLWSNAMQLIQAAPWVGWGSVWLIEWRKTAYPDVGYNLIHNGYLEIMVRHGLLGIVFLLVFISVSAYSIRDAHRRGVVPSSLAAYLYSISLFFLCTIATNSNNRLAIGESFFIFASAAVFSIRLSARSHKDKPFIR